jgi:outer membrane lipoprotein-sorting protein
MKRWLLPAAAVGLLVAAGLASGAVRSAPSLPRRNADDLLQRAIAAAKSPPSFHGTVRVRSSMTLPSPDGGAAADPLVGDRVVRVWHRAPDLWRAESYASPGATDGTVVVADGHTVLVWRAQDNTFITRPWRAGGGAVPDLARIDGWLASLQGSTDLTVDRDASVAGRPAYHLEARPRAEDVLVGAVHVWIDGQTFLPLQVQVTDRSGTPALTAGFSAVAMDADFGAPPASLFDTRPPAGARPAETAHAAPPAPRVRRTPGEGLAAAQAAVDFPLKQPSQLPDGMTLTGASARGGAAALRYGEGWRMLVLTEGRTPPPVPAGRSVDLNGQPAQLVVDGVVSAVSWTADGIHLTLAGSLDPDVLLRVARSVR